jgi:hypothetical protein
MSTATGQLQQIRCKRAYLPSPLRVFGFRLVEISPVPDRKVPADGTGNCGGSGSSPNIPALPKKNLAAILERASKKPASIRRLIRCYLTKERR